MTLHEMKQKAAAIRKQMRDMHKAIGDSEMSDSQQEEWDQRSQELTRLNDLIKGEEEKRLGDQRFVSGQKARKQSGWVDTRTGAGVEVYSREEMVADHAEPVPEEYRGLTVGGFMRAVAIGGRTEEEKRALSSGSGSAGGYTVPVEILPRFIDQMREASRAVQAGAQTIMLPAGETTIARLDSDPVPAWRLENAEVAKGDPSFGRVEFSAKSLAVLVKCSEELLQDSVNIDQILMQSLAAAMAAEVDRVALYGSGTDPEPLGIANTAGVLPVNSTGKEGYTSVTAGCRELAKVNCAFPTALILNPIEQYDFADLADTTGQPLMRPKVIENLPFLDTTKATAGEMLLGDFTRLLIGMRQQLNIKILTERFSDNNQIGFLCTLRADTAAEWAKAFCKIAAA